MVNPKKQQSVDERKIEDMNRVDESNDGGFDDSSSSVGASTSAISGGSGVVEVGLTERLTDILVEEGDGDLLLQQSGREDRVMQWLLALDLQVMGACRADERLKPLLKLNVSSGAAEDRLLAHLSHHFEPSEVGMLARCLCVPLVSIRVGKINKQGNLLCPTATRGNLNLTLLPTSDLRISFIGDDGRAERLLTISSDSQCSAVAVEDIPADNSGRSFMIKIPDGEVFYFWCAEKSELLGLELLSKMKDLLNRKPSLAELTGISESRLDCFATHLRAYLIGSTVTNTSATAIVSLSSCPEMTSGSSELGQTAQSSPASLKASRSRPCGGSQAAKTNSPYQISLNPRSSSFEEGPPRNLTSLKSLAIEKLKRYGDRNLSSCDNNPFVFPEITTDASSSNHSEKYKLSQTIETHLLSPSSFSESCDKSAAPPFLGRESQVPLLGSSLLSPYYCWCPPSQLPITSSESLFLPPLTSLLPATRSSSVEIPPMDFPPFLPETLVRLPLSMPSSQQIPTFTPLMCDSIVHIPVIDVCSSGQGYLVSAGPAISTSIAPLYPNLVNPLIPQADSMAEKSARETLRLLISSSSQTNQQFLSGGDEKQSIFVGGSRSLYCGVTDVSVIANSIAAMGMVSLSERSVGATDLLNRCIGQGSFVDQLEKSSGPGGSCSEDESPIFSELHDERGPRE